jgi:hypothetical protein
MNSKYQQYYNALNGKSFTSYVSGYTNSLSDISTNLTNIETAISSSNEKGMDFIKGTTIPSLKTQLADMQQGFQALTTAATKTDSLISKLNELKNASDMYLSCKEEEKETYRSKISSLEREIDSLISEINSISLSATTIDGNQNVVVGSLNNTVVTDANIAELKKKFIGDVNNSSQYYFDPKYAKKLKRLVCFDNTTGEVYEDGATFHMKPGETRVLTVRLPYYAGEIDKVMRTTADGCDTFRSGTIATAVCDINPDPDVVDFVNYKEWSNHFPKGVDLHTNYYEWIITAKTDGNVHVSQTCEYTNTSGDMPKAMIGLNLVVDKVES